MANSRMKRASAAAALVLASGTARAQGAATTFPEPGVGQGGSIGFGRLVAADAGRPGALRLGVRGGLFQGNDFPASGTDRLLLGELSLSYGAAENLEVYAAYRNSSNSNTKALPALVQAQGDAVLGAKYALEAGGVRAGADLRLDLRNGIGGDFWAPSASHVELRGLASKAFEAGEHRLTLHVNAGVALGRSADAVDPRMTPALLFGSGLSGHHRVLAALGAQYDLGAFLPYLGLDLDLPLGLDPADLEGFSSGAFGAAAKRLTLGTRVLAGKAGAFDFLAELGTGSGARGFARTQPWTLFAAYSFAFDSNLYAPPPPPPAPPPPTTGQVGGTVRDLATGKPLGHAEVTVLGVARPPVASDDAGAFATYELPAGPVTLHVERDGYEPASIEAQVAAGRIAAADLRLEALPTPPPPPPPPAPPAPPPPSGFIAGKLLVPGGHASGLVRISGPRTVETRFDDQGTFSYRVPPGNYEIVVLPDHQVARRLTASVLPDDVAVVAATLVPSVSPPPFTVDGDKVVPAKALTLDEKKAVPAAADEPTLLALADLLVREPGRKLTILVHSEAGKNVKGDRKAWTEERATALRQAIIGFGGPEERIEARGMGFEQPLVPANAKDRAKNRRVELQLSSVPVARTAAPAPLPPARNASAPAVPLAAPSTVTAPPAPAPEPAATPAKAPAATLPDTLPPLDGPEIPLPD